MSKRQKITPVHERLLELKKELGSRFLIASVFLALSLMFLGPGRLLFAVNNAAMNMDLNVNTGSLSLTAPSATNFNSASPGETAVANTTTSEIVVNDTRGSKAGWHVTGYFNTNFYKTTDSNVQMAVNDGGTLRMFWGANNGSGGSTINNVTGTSGEAIGGANDNFTGIESSNSLTLMTDSASGDNGAGAFNMVNLKFNYSVPVSASATSYRTTLILTVS